MRRGGATGAGVPAAVGACVVLLGLLAAAPRLCSGLLSSGNLRESLRDAWLRPEAVLRGPFGHHEGYTSRPLLAHRRTLLEDAAGEEESAGADDQRPEPGSGDDAGGAGSGTGASGEGASGTGDAQDSGDKVTGDGGDEGTAAGVKEESEGEGESSSSAGGQAVGEGSAGAIVENVAEDTEPDQAGASSAHGPGHAAQEGDGKKAGGLETSEDGAGVGEQTGARAGGAADVSRRSRKPKRRRRHSEVRQRRVRQRHEQKQKRDRIKFSLIEAEEAAAWRRQNSGANDVSASTTAPQELTEDSTTKADSAGGADEADGTNLADNTDGARGGGGADGARRGGGADGASEADGADGAGANGGAAASGASGGDGGDGSGAGDEAGGTNGPDSGEGATGGDEADGASGGERGDAADGDTGGPRGATAEQGPEIKGALLLQDSPADAASSGSGDVAEPGKAEGAEDWQAEGGQASGRPDPVLSFGAGAKENEDSGNSGVPEDVPVVHAAEGEGMASTATGVDDIGGGRDEKAESAAATMSAEQQLELEKSVHEEEEVHAPFMSEVMRIRGRLRPTLSGMRDKTRKLLLPRLAHLAKSTRAAFAHTSKSLSNGVAHLVGPHMSPRFATAVSYSLMLLPLLLIVLLVNQVRTVLSLRKVLLLANMYLCLYCFGLLATSIIVSAEPMALLRAAAEPNFLILQIVQALGYLLYMLVQMAFLVSVLRNKTDEARFPLLKATLHLLASTSVGLHYYVTVFEPAMLDHSLRTQATAYLAYCLTFFILTLLSQATKKDQVKQR